MGDDWDDGPSGGSVMVEPQTNGRTFGGRGRGFAPPSSEDRRPGGFRGNDGGGRGGYRGRRNDEDGEGGRGGYQGRRNEEDGEGGRGGGYRGKRNEEDGEGGRGGGGYRGKRNDEDGEGGRGGGYRGRRNDDGEGGGGYKGRRDDNERGGGWGGDGEEGQGDRRPRRRDDGEGGEGGDEPPKPPRSTYVPPEPSTNPDEIFAEGISSGINFANYDKIEVKVTTADHNKAPPAIHSFEDAGLRPFVLSNILKSKYTTPTPIQKQAIPIVCGGRDLMGCAQTGSGKTAAFLIPIINTLLGDPRDLVLEQDHAEPQVVIVTPTRELTQQICSEARKFSHGSILKVIELYGGTAVSHQLRQMFNAGAHIIVATPGRLLDFVNRGKITFSSIRFVVLDEADRMLDMGFMGEMEKMLQHPTMVPKGERQTLMFSATFPEEVQRLAAKFLHDYVFVTVGIVGGACADVEQRFYQVSKFEKREKLVELLRESTKRTLVFVEQKRTADIIATYLSEKDFPTTSIHGDREQREREEALRDFKTGRMAVLVATAVAARGLDIKGVAHVINYDLPKLVDEYVHRIGRTGRVGNRGLATSFFDEGFDGNLAGDLVRILRQAGQEVPEFLTSAGGGGGGYGGTSSSFGGRDVRGPSGRGGGDMGSAAPQAFEEEEW